VPTCAKPLPGYEKTGCIFATFWETPVLIEPGGAGGTNWSPMPYSPDTGYFYVPGTIRPSSYVRYGDTYKKGQRYVGGTQAPPIGAPLSGNFTAIGSRTNKIVWRQQMPFRMGGGGGSTVTAGGLLLRGEPDGNFVALDAKTGDVLWKFQTGFGADAPPMVYEVDDDEYIAIVTGGNSIQGSANGDALWAFALKGQIGPLYPPPPPTTAAPIGAIIEGADTVKIADLNAEYVYFPARTQVKVGTTVTFTNLGDLPHTATATGGDKVKWDTGLLAKGESKSITFNEAGTHYYLCTIHPWMYGVVYIGP
jgi:alcohol dehydrogenase (cytochrome c)